MLLQSQLPDDFSAHPDSRPDTGKSSAAAGTSSLAAGKFVFKLYEGSAKDQTDRRPVAWCDQKHLLQDSTRYSEHCKNTVKETAFKKIQGKKITLTSL